MGLLGKIFSAGDRAKRNLLDFVQNPVESVQQAVGHVNDRARAFNELNDAALAETNASGRFNMGAPATSKLAQTLADAYNPIAMTVYHGSPHLFSRFDASKIGTGEGAQAYGHGLYVAESPEVAKMYQATTSKDRFLTNNGFFDPSDLEHLNVKAVTRRGDLEQAIATARKYAVPDSDYPEVAAKAARDLAKLESIKASGGMRTNPGALYKIDLPDEHIAKMLDWDKPLSQQAPEVRMLAKDLGISEQEVGAKFYQALANQARDGAIARGQNAGTTLGASQAAASDDLRAFGIPGIRYLDGGSRGVGQGTSNFVVFPGNEGLLTILERNGKPIPR